MQTPSNFSKGDTPLDLQQSFWNGWNAEFREDAMSAVSHRQAEIVTGWLERLGRTDLDLLEVGCGSAWFAPALGRFGTVTATDLSDEVLDRAAKRWPQATFVAGDFMALDLGVSRFDVVVSLEVLSHVFDQTAFIRKIARHLKPGGLLMLATQNRHVLERYNAIPPPAPGQLRRWVYREELASLLVPDLEPLELFTVSPIARVGIMRWVNSRKVNAPIRAIFGDRVERMKERAGLGWTLMALARKVRAEV